MGTRNSTSGRARLAGCVGGALLLAAATPGRGGGGHYGPLELRPKDALLIEKSAEIEDFFVRRAYVLPDGPETRLVRRVGDATRPAVPVDRYQRFRYGVVRNGLPNAFALPDGQIYVHTGLLAKLENEAQLAQIFIYISTYCLKLKDTHHKHN